VTEKPIFAKQEEKHKKSEKDSAGEAVGFRGIVRDITERRQAEETLKEQTKTLNNILEKAADGICVCHNISEEPYVRFTHWNPRMTEITGYSIEEINRFGWHQLKSLLYNLNAISD
jgi:PAS domain-containing protein